MKILAVIPARGGSKGIPRKNIALLRGRPLIAYTIDAARAATSLERIFVSTDDTEIAAVSRSLGAEVVMRPAELARDESGTLLVLQHAVAELAGAGYRPDAVMTLQPTSPLRTSFHIDEAARAFVNDPIADSLVSCIEVPHVFHPYSVMRRTAEGYLVPFLDLPQPGRRQDKEPVFARNGAAIYITRTERLGTFIFGGRLIPYTMPEAASTDIDSPADLAAAERLLAGQLTK
jgi:CMP-N,N'-diacetyllegionaminic acid synthase